MDDYFEKMESLLAHDVDTVGWLLTKFSAGISLEMNVMYNVHVHQKQIFRKYNCFMWERKE